MLNVPGYAGGRRLWGADPSCRCGGGGGGGGGGGAGGAAFAQPSPSDGLLEVLPSDDNVDNDDEACVASVPARAPPPASPPHAPRMGRPPTRRSDARVDSALCETRAARPLSPAPDLVCNPAAPPPR